MMTQPRENLKEEKRDALDYCDLVTVLVNTENEPQRRREHRERSINRKGAKNAKVNIG
jgi:hypothetical protein